MVRHELLNPRDIPIRAEDIAQLDAYLVVLSAKLRPVARRFFETRSREMIAHIEEGLVAPIVPVPRSVKSMKWLAAVLAKRRGLGKSAEARLLDEIKANPSKFGAVDVSGSSIRHGGKIYLQRDFPALPVAEGVLAQLQGLLAEGSVVFLEWFASLHLLGDQELIRLMEDLAAGREATLRTGAKPRNRAVRRRRE